MSVTRRTCGALIAAASRLVPRRQREAWREEWEAEVWYGLRGEAGGGVSPSRRMALALRCFGAFPHALWLCAGEWSVDSVAQDIRYGTRTLLRRPAFTVVAALTLALGIGGNTAVFSIVNAVLLRQLPIANADRLVYTWGRMFPGGPGASVSPPDYLDYRDGTRSVFEEFAAQSSFGLTVVIETEAGPEELRGRAFTANFLDALGHAPAAGRAFTDEETQVGGEAVVMISHGLWGRMYGFDPGAVGSTLRMDGAAHTIIGVLPADLDYPRSLDVWFPLEFGGPGYDSRAAHFLRPVGLLRPGVTVEQAQSVLDVVSARLEAAFPETNDEWYATLQPLRDVLVGNVRPALVVLLAAVGLVLLIACVNVVNLLLARAAARRGEIAVRSAMGATRFRLARQLMTESVLLALLGGAAGIAFAWLGVEALRVLQPGNLPRLEEVGVDGATLGFCALLSLGAGLVFGMVPAVGLRRHALKGGLAAAGRGMSGGGRRLRAALVAGEVALSFVLLIGAGLLLRSFLALRSVDPGFDVAGAVVVPVSLPERAWPEGDALEATRDAIRDELAAVAGVAGVGAASIVPLSGGGGDTYVYAETRPPASIRNVDNTAQIRFVDEGWFDVMGIPMVAGRAFERSDGRDAPGRVILNERLARDLFPDEDPIGQRMVVWLDELRPLEIVGVAADVRQFSLDVPAQREFYLSARQRDLRTLSFVVRGRGPVPPPAAALRDAVRRADPGQPVNRIVPLESYVAVAVATDRFQALLVLLFAIMAAALSAIGIHGVLAHTVGQRRREIGIRMAMGADRWTVARMVIGEGLGVALTGAAIGIAGAIATARALGSLLFDIRPVDPLTWIATAVFLLAIVLLSSWLPARQAARTDPATVLREEL